LGCDFLTVLIDQKHHLGRGVHSQSRQDSLYLVVLLFTQKDWFCHCVRLFIEGRGGMFPGELNLKRLFSGIASF
jgi:hypothetical protein